MLIKPRNAAIAVGIPPPLAEGERFRIYTVINARRAAIAQANVIFNRFFSAKMYISCDFLIMILDITLYMHTQTPVKAPARAGRNKVEKAKLTAFLSFLTVLSVKLYITTFIYLTNY
ncbi:hypothetical protein SDC9_122380 [bioreactor metagenome]|uniref:Uncharacterized protein n=1 Tax=bioreactor metagenome TaxID=1076179 RepID=A0A645CEQ5_9ZZZZ